MSAKDGRMILAGEPWFAAHLDEWFHRHPLAEAWLPRISKRVCDYRDRRLLEGTDR